MTRRFHTKKPGIDEFERHLLSVRGTRGKPRYTPRTARLYANTMNRALHLGDALAVLRGARTTSLWLQAGNAVLAWARWKDDANLAASVGQFPDPKVTTHETEVPPLGDWAAILDTIQKAVPEPQRYVMVILLTTGLRVGDVLRLTRDQIDLVRTNRSLVIGQKGDHARKWRPGREAHEALCHLLVDPNWRILRDLFDAHPDRPLTELQRQQGAYHAVRKMLLWACSQAGVDFIRLHRYRHGVAARAHAKGAPLERIQEMLGHSDSRTTKDYYLHLGDEVQANLADGILDDLRQAGR